MVSYCFRVEDGEDRVTLCEALAGERFDEWTWGRVWTSVVLFAWFALVVVPISLFGSCFVFFAKASVVLVAFLSCSANFPQTVWIIQRLWP